MSRRRTLPQKVAELAPKARDIETKIPCPLCHNTTDAYGRERARDGRIVALDCPCCGHSWAVPLREFRLMEAAQQAERDEPAHATATPTREDANGR